MPRPCDHWDQDPLVGISMGCPICTKYVSSPDHKKYWDELEQPSLIQAAAVRPAMQPLSVVGWIEVLGLWVNVEGDDKPVGLRIWPAGLSLAEEILKQGMSGTVADLGCGLGLAGMTAARVGADVTFIDSEELVVSRIQEHLERNRLKGNIIRSNAIDLEGRFDNIIAGDFLYSEAAVESAIKVVNKNWTGKGVCWFTSPFRSKHPFPLLRTLISGYDKLSWQMPLYGYSVRPPQNRSLECYHLGDLVDKHGCNSGARWEYECDIHKRCTKLHQDRKDIPCCQTCNDFSESPPVEIKVVDASRKIVLLNKQSPGDSLVMSAALECLHRQHPGKFKTAVRCCCPAIFTNNPHASEIPIGETWEEIEMHCPHIHQSDQRPIHFMESYCKFLGERLGVPIELTVNRPFLYFSPEEGMWISRVQEILGEPKKHFLINAGVKQDYTAKGWITDYWQEVVDRLKDKILLVQVGEAHHLHPKLDGVLDQIGKTNTREFIRLCKSSEGGAGPVSFMQHIMAALQKPYISIQGGREGKMWTEYPTQTSLHTIGVLDCCKTGGCWKSRIVPLGDGDHKDNELCTNSIPFNGKPVQKCMTLIRPDDVVRIIQRYEFHN